MPYDADFIRDLLNQGAQDDVLGRLMGHLVQPRDEHLLASWEARTSNRIRVNQFIFDNLR